MSPEFSKTAALMFFLLNPFFMSVYLLDFYQTLDKRTFASVLVRGSTIATTVFVCFAGAGDRIFNDVLHARFSSFLIFGGVVFFMIGLKFVFQGEQALSTWRGKPEHIAGAIAMPFMIGPGTVGASVLAGLRLPFWEAALAIISSVFAACLTIVLLKLIFDFVKERNERLIQRYVDIMGRVMALVIGTFSIEMIFQGIETWLKTVKL